MPSFYLKYGGAVVSFTINKYVWVILGKKFDKKIRVSYSETENVEHAKEIKHDLIRETLLFNDVEQVEVVTVADIPGQGTGLGSSSALVVGLLNAICAYRCEMLCGQKKYLAETSFMIEHDRCKHILGKQDHYASTYGGLHLFEFKMDGSVRVEPIHLAFEEIEFLEKHLMLFWTGKTRSASSILQEVNKNFINEEAIQHGIRMKEMAFELRDDIRRRNFHRIGEYLDLNWQIKKNTAKGVSDDEIDGYYDRAMKAGAVGGKLCGAGGGGFLLFWVDPEKQKSVLEAIALEQVSTLRITERGSEVVYV